ncbi:MAG: hypothetical protein ACT4TC_02965 [Myxococcaceae bacterium]
MLRWMRWAWLFTLLALPVSAQQTASPHEEEVRAGLKRAQQAYDLARFEAALNEYTQAYRLDPLPALLFNMAQCHRQLANYERAAFFYRRYLDLSPKRPQNAELVEGLIREVKASGAEEHRQKKLQERAKLTEGVKMPPPPALTPKNAGGPVTGGVMRNGQLLVEESPVYKKWWFWTAVGVGAAAIAGGTVYGINRASQRSPTSLEPIYANQ